MTIPLLALALIVALVPTLGLVGRLEVLAAILVVLAAALATTAVATPAIKLRRLARLMQPGLLALLATPALWMLIQLLPIPNQGLSNQIWASAASALHHPLVGAITIDTGATLLSLAQYGMVVAALLVATAVALDQKQAASFLYVLIAVSTAGAIRLIISELGLFELARTDSEELVFVAVLGTILSSAAAVHLYDQTPRFDRARQAGIPPVDLLAAACSAFAVCAGAILVRGEAGTVVATLLGNATVGSVFIVRRWSLGSWGKAGLAVSVVLVLLGAVATIPIRHNADLAVAWSAQSQLTTERMLADVPFAGSGAGVYEALLPIYRDIGSNDDAPVTTAAVIIVGMGRPFFGGLIIAVICCAWLLFRRALMRRQDYAFASAGAAMLVAGPLLLFVNGGAFGFGASLLAGMAGGLALGQSSSSREAARLAPQAVLPSGVQATGAPLAILPRCALALLALLLVVQATWIFGAEGYQFGRHRLLQPAASTSARLEDARRAAAFAVVRGELWTKSARLQIARREPHLAAGPGPSSMLAREDLERALSYAPHRSDAWLMLALLAERNELAGYDVGTLLKMSYYTAPNDIALIPLRLDAALRTETKAHDIELHDMIRRDISLVVTRQPELRPILAATYRSASPPQKSIAERIIFEVDPDYLKSIRTP